MPQAIIQLSGGMNLATFPCRHCEDIHPLQGKTQMFRRSLDEAGFQQVCLLGATLASPFSLQAALDLLRDGRQCIRLTVTGRLKTGNGIRVHGKNFCVSPFRGDVSNSQDAAKMVCWVLADAGKSQAPHRPGVPDEGIELLQGQVSALHRVPADEGVNPLSSVLQ